ncbi:serine hydrolase domain-containing protein [Actinomadura miaoliensis]|uniref:Serine hydrolase domain-containing protein n=2 Tax=Actinomadura miaoliensis TaxID=430685 RepID=A0ABP7W7L3_9ACTN
MLSGALALTVALTGQPAVADSEYAELRQVVRRLTAQDGAVGAQAVVDGRHGRTAVAEGVGDLRTGAPMPRGGRFRIGSLTKPFVATVVLQLVGEGKVDLDAPVEDYLPGLLGDGAAEKPVTVRHLLQQTSGLPDVLDHLPPSELINDRFRHWEPRELVEIALSHPRLFEPGARWDYSNTNYTLAAMLIERVTGRTYGEEIHRRILKPLRLTDTSVPGDRTGIPGRHPRGYVRTGTQLLDLTELNPTMAAGSGDMISSARDLNRFLAALLRGGLLRPAQQREMMTTRPTGNESGAEYGLGLQKFPLKGCDGEFWGHGGDMLGFTARSGATVDGRQVTVMVNLNPGGTRAQKDDHEAAVSAALCA